MDAAPGDSNALSDAYLFSLTGTTGGGGPVPLPTCKLLDTRRRADRPALRSNTHRTVRAAGVCGVPATAKSVAVTVTALQATGKGNLRLYAGNNTVTSSGGVSPTITWVSMEHNIVVKQDTLDASGAVTSVTTLVGL